MLRISIRRGFAAVARLPYQCLTLAQVCARRLLFLRNADGGWHDVDVGAVAGVVDADLQKLVGHLLGHEDRVVLDEVDCRRLGAACERVERRDPSIYPWGAVAAADGGQFLAAKDAARFKVADA